MKNKEFKIESTVLSLNQKLQKQYNSIPNIEILEDVETITERLSRQGGSIAFKKVITYKFNNIKKEMKIGEIQGYKLPEERNLLVCKSRTNIGFTYSYFNTQIKTPVGVIFIAPTGVLTEKTTTSECLHFTPLFNTNKNRVQEKINFLLQTIATNDFIKNEKINFNKAKNATTKKQIKLNKNFELLDTILSFTIAIKTNRQFIMGTTPESFKKSVNILSKLQEKVGKLQEELNTKGINLFVKTNPLFSSVYEYTKSKELIIEILNTLSEHYNTIKFKIVYDEFHHIFNNGEYRGGNIDKFFNELKQINEEKLINLSNIIFVSASDILPMFSSLDKNTKEYVANRWFNPLELDYIKFEFVDENEDQIYDFDGTLQTKIINIDEDNIFRHNLIGRGLNKTKSAKTVYSVSEDENTEYDIERMNKSVKKVINILIENDTKYSFYKEFASDGKYDYSGKVLYEMYVNNLKTQFNIMYAQMLIHGTLLKNYAFFTTPNTWKNTKISGIEFLTKYADGIKLMLENYKRKLTKEWGSIENKAGLFKEHELYTDRLIHINEQLTKLEVTRRAITYKSSADGNKYNYSNSVLEMVAYYVNNSKNLSLDFVFSLLPSADDVIAELKSYSDDEKLNFTLKNDDGTFNFFIPAHITSNKSLNVMGNRIFSFYTDGTTAGRDFFVPKRSDKRFEEISEVVNIALQQFIDTQSSIINTNALHQCCGRLRNLPSHFERKLIIINMVNNNFVNKFVEKTLKMGGMKETDQTVLLLEQIVTEQMLPIKHIATNINTVIECVRNEVEKYDFEIEKLVEQIKSHQFVSFGGNFTNYREMNVTKENKENVKELFDELVHNEDLSSNEKVNIIHTMYKLGAFTKEDLTIIDNNNNVNFIDCYEKYDSLQNFIDNMAKTMVSASLNKSYSKNNNHAKNAINIINSKCETELEVNTGYQLTTSVNSMNTLAVFQGEKAFNDFVQTMLSSCKLTPVLHEDKLNIIAEHKFINSFTLNTYVLTENISAKNLSDSVGNEKEEEEISTEINIIANSENGVGVEQYDNETVNIAITQFPKVYTNYCNTNGFTDEFKGTDNMTLQIKNINNSDLYNIYKELVDELQTTVKMRQSNIESVKYLKFREFDSLPHYITNAEFSVLPAYMTAVFASAYGKLFSECNPSDTFNFSKIEITTSDKKRLSFPHFKRILHEVMPIYAKLFNNDEKMVKYITENLRELTANAIEKHKRAYVRLQKGYRSNMYVHCKIDKVTNTFNINPDYDLGVMNDELLQCMKDLCNHLIFKLNHKTIVNADELKSNDERTTKIYKWLMRDYIVCRMYDINSTYGTTQQALDMCPAYFASDVLRGGVKE